MLLNIYLKKGENVMFKKLTCALMLSAMALALTTEAAEYSNIRMNNIDIKGQGEAATVTPGETFGVHATYEFLSPREKGSIVQIIVGLKDIGAQTCIANGLVNYDGRFYDHLPLAFRGQHIDITKKDVDFALVAPQEPGTYALQFRYAQAYLPHEAVAGWWNVDQAPTDDATIGYITVE